MLCGIHRRVVRCQQINEGLASDPVQLCTDTVCFFVAGQGAAKQLKRYSCPLCMALKNQPHDLDAAISRTRRTRSDSCPTSSTRFLAGLENYRKQLRRGHSKLHVSRQGSGSAIQADSEACLERCRRPDRGGLAQLVQEAAALPCTMPEQVTLMHILSSYDRWQVRLCAWSPVVHPSNFVFEQVPVVQSL